MEQSGNDRLAGYVARDGALHPIDTPAGYLARGDGLTLYCSDPLRCRGDGPHVGVSVDFEALVAKGWGDAPIEALRQRWRCRHCGAKPTVILSSGGAPKGGGYPKW